jgi:hypothetical protein
MMRIGMACLGLAFAAGLVLDLSLPFADGHLNLRYNSGDGAPATLIHLTAALGFLLILTGFLWEALRYRKEQHHLSRKRVFVIEARGLRDTNGTPLVAKVPKELSGVREQVLIDLRQRIKDGVLTDPVAAVNDLMSLPADLRRRENGLDRNDLSFVYGGLSPVPLTFLTGFLLDDEGKFVVMDWDRHSENWRPLDGADDGARFVATGLENVKSGASDIALAVSVSYRIGLGDIQERAGQMNLVELTLSGGNTNSHWSEAKQIALGKQFLETLVHIKGLGVQRVHLFLAAQNSVVFRFGRLYDKRNLPEVIVYQYQRGEMPAYAWGVKMPTSGINIPEVIR